MRVPSHSDRLPRRRPRRPAAAASALERLEGRTLFAINLVSDADGNFGLQVTGTSGNDVITISDDPSIDQPFIIGAGAMPALGSNPIRFYDVDTGSGNDNVAFITAGNYANDIRGINFELGSGDDVLTVVLDDVDNNSGINMEVLGQSGKDTVFFDAGNLENGSTLDLFIDGGTDSDVVTARVVDLIDDSAFTLQAQLGSGTTNSLETFIGFVDTDASAAYSVSGDSGADTVKTHLLDDVEGSVGVTSFLGNGNDRHTFDIGSFFDLSAGGELRVNLNGGGGNDNLAVLLDRTNTDFELSGRLDVTLNGDNGNDTLTVDLIADTNLQTFLTGVFRLRVSGGDGSDSVTTRLQWDAGSTGSADVRLSGDSGGDTFRFTLIDNSGFAVNYTGGRVLVDAGSGLDTRIGTVITGVSASEVVFLRFDNVVP